MMELYWIDDNFNEMFYIVKGIIKKLWRLDEQDAQSVKSIITILGNASSCDSEELSKQYREDAEKDIIDLYSKACFEIDGPCRERPTYYNKENRQLIEEAIKFFPQDFNAKKETNEELYKELKQVWGNSDGSVDEKEYEYGQEIVKDFIMSSGIGENSKVGIDIMLMKGDKERINKGERIFSIELYEQLRKKQCACFLFSSEGSRDSFVEKCEEIYKTQYLKGEEINKLRIFDRKELQGKGVPESFNELSQVLGISI